MRIITGTETPQQFTERLFALLQADTTHLYFDTSFLMWLTMVGDEARAQFRQWTASMGERTHIPLWSMHEFHRHHRSGTLRADLVKRADGLMSAAKLFRQEVGRYADQRMQVGQSGAAFQDSVDNALELLKDLTDVARRWDYDRCAADVISWMNERACANRTVFRSLESLEARGAARYTQDVPPGFLDRIKQDSPDKGSNKYGDLLFWQEVVEDAQKKGARAVIIVTRDRKEDWFAGEPDPNLTLD